MPVPTITNQKLQIRPVVQGAGGFCGQFKQHKTARHACWITDTYAAFVARWNGTSYDPPVQVVTGATMSAPYNTPNAFSFGALDIAFADSDPTGNTMYMLVSGTLFKSTTWPCAWSPTSIANVPDANGFFAENTIWRMEYPTRLSGPRIGVCPTDANIVLVGDNDNGLWRCTDGQNFTMISNAKVPAPNNSASSNQGVWPVLWHPTVAGRCFTHSFGNGWIRNDNYGAEADWSSVMSNSPSRFQNWAEIDAAGNIYTVENNSPRKLWRMNGTTFAWADPTGAGAGVASPISGTVVQSWEGFAAVTVDPFNTARLVIESESGKLIVSANSGGTLACAADTSFESTIDWQVHPDDYEPIRSYMSAAQITHDKFVQNRLWKSWGLGIARMDAKPLAANDPVHWVDVSRGIEQLVTNNIAHLPNGNQLGFADWDRPVSLLVNPDKPSLKTIANEDINASGVLVQRKAIRDCNNIDFLPDGSLITVATDDRLPSFNFAAGWYGGTGYSLDGLQTTTAIKPPPFSVSAYRMICKQLVPFSDQKFLFVGDWGNRPYSTANRGATWETFTLLDGAGVEVSSYAFTSTPDFDVKAAASDRVNPLRGLLHKPSVGIWRTIDGSRSYQWLRGPINTSPFQFHPRIRSVWGKAGHYLYTPGAAAGIFTHPFQISEDEGVTWTAFDGVADVHSFDTGYFDANSMAYPGILICGRVNGVWGIWLSEDKGASWRLVTDFSDGYLNNVEDVALSKVHPRRGVIGFGGFGAVYFDGALPGRRRVELRMAA